VFVVAVSADESGEDALDWLMSELVEDGDEVVGLRVIELDEGGEWSHHIWIPTKPVVERTDPSAQDEFREDAHTLLANMLEKNNEAESRKVW
jgi:hypothetical protein